MYCGVSVIPWWEEISQLMILHLGLGQSELQDSFQTWGVVFGAYVCPCRGGCWGFCVFFNSKKSVSKICTSTTNPMCLGYALNLPGEETPFPPPPTLLKLQRWGGRCPFVNVRHRFKGFTGPRAALSKPPIQKHESERVLSNLFLDMGGVVDIRAVCKIKSSSAYIYLKWKWIHFQFYTSSFE